MFTSKLWSELTSFQRTQLRLSSAFRPEADGRIEIINHFVADYLRAFVNARHDDWDEMLSLADFTYNARVHSSTGMAPFTADLGYIPRSVADLATPSIRGRRSQAGKFVEHQQVMLQQCKDMLEQSQAAMKYFDYRNCPTFQCAEDTYQIGLPPGLQLNDEFHVSYLRPYVFDSDPRRYNDVPPLITRDGFEGVQVEQILQRRVKNGKVQFKVRWYGRDNKDSWEPEENLEQVRGLIERFHLAQPQRSTR
ncbi:Retrotransposon nucleocapsid protein [Phytophthora megakarya]|uniref:Retrotransposon nucleocapsid protein n=1 Tax=Phytophthora megakarya TaxID=4795 RepID=A0A225VSS4_9STRA|nr:Retrotransposon nucleocapsid protein [Phytophthora megakarya]